jgi:hypothetical protein
MKQLFVVSLIILTLVLAPTLTQDLFAKKKSADSKAKDAIIKALGKAVEGKFSKIELSSFKLFDSNVTVTYWNKTSGPVIPPPPPKCLPTEHLENGKCVPNTTPSTANSTIVCMVGDIGGTAVSAQMDKQGCDVKIGLGDLTYKSTIDNFVKLKFDKCVVGNHDANENAKGDPIVKQALLLCGESWWLKVGNSTLFMGFNTNGNLDTQLGAAQDFLTNTTFMQGITNVHFLSHKPICMTPPNSHHPLELPATFCDSLLHYVPAGVKVYFENGHNHVLAQTKDGQTSTVGGGEKSHYGCGTNAIWVFCNNNDFGFLMIIIDNHNGNQVSKFISTSGTQLYPK